MLIFGQQLCCLYYSE